MPTEVSMKGLLCSYHQLHTLPPSVLHGGHYKEHAKGKLCGYVRDSLYRIQSDKRYPEYG
ncbi:hypothetical protein KUL106_06640 [Alteromonas sp. KUL106]|nr:hypothetical protein KUL106_06640 [Alteromonas sp. KUL106]